MKVVAFVGPSGTGKSYRAAWLAKEGNIEFIIDDGLLIHKNHIIAGKSAKREPTKVASVKRALFTDPDHVRDVKKAIESYKANTLLILGTSDKMVNSIREKLNLPEFLYIIHIEDVASKEDIEKAKQIRQTLGKHIIPAPTFEVRKHFSGYFLDSIKVFFGLSKGEDFEASKTLVRPTFSYLGDYTISDQVIIDLSNYALRGQKEIKSVLKILVNQVASGIYINIELSVKYLPKVFNESYNLYHFSKKVQAAVQSEVEKYTLINVEGVNVVIRSLAVSK